MPAKPAATTPIANTSRNVRRTLMPRMPTMRWSSIPARTTRPIEVRYSTTHSSARVTAMMPITSSR